MARRRLPLAVALLLVLATVSCAPPRYRSYDGVPDARGQGFGAANEFQPRRQAGGMNPGT
ncbi:hypothetical protein [Roseococcus sp.]|uniref:hypothetical protein n=1 Tax=Roseococcus sp. TaxID=2109646 RepID=UPI003BAA4E8C